MRKNILFLLISGIVSPLFSQVGYFAFGYNGNYFISENLDFVIDRYNETRPYLDETMDYPHYLDGLDIHFGGGTTFLFDFGYSWRGKEVSAKGVDGTGVLVQRDLKLKYGGWNFALAYNFVQTGNAIFAIGYNQTIGSQKISTRVGPATDIEDEEYISIIKSFSPAAELFLQFGLPLSDNAAVIIKPYYHIGLVETDYGEVNRIINPATAGADELILESKPKGFGASIMFAFGTFTN